MPSQSIMGMHVTPTQVFLSDTALAESAKMRQDSMVSACMLTEKKLTESY